MQVQVKNLTKLPKTTENGTFRALLLRVLLLPGPVKSFASLTKGELGGLSVVWPQ
jgi:hypothetical protein